MVRLKRFFYLSLFNILISATATLAVLYFWDAGKERLAAFQLAAAQTPAQPAVTIIVVSAPSEATAAVETLGLPTQIPDTPLPVTPTPPSFLYLVEAGDTLASIADRFDVALQDILAINNLADPNNLSVGQEITIPTGPLPTSIPTFTPTPTPAPSSSPTPRTTRPATATPSPTPGVPEIVIESILGSGDLSTEKVKITLQSGSSVSLAGWRLVDSQENIFVFPQLDLFPGGSVQVNTRSGLNTATELYWGMDAAVWQPGEKAQLFDAEGNLRATYQVP